MYQPFLHQKVRLSHAAIFLAAGTALLLVIAALMQAAVPAVSGATEGNPFFFTLGPGLLWTGMFLPLLFFLP
jgi:hypothetical protein